MKKYFLIISILFGFTSKAQIYHPFPTKNTVWTELFYPGGGDFNRLYHNYALKDKDTIIHGKQYQKFYHSFDTIFTENKVCGALREENKRIYYYSIDSLINLRTPLSTPIPVDTEIILYDFNLQVGDTITADQYRLRHADALVVAKIDSILISTELRKRYTFGSLDGYLIKTEQWVEGVGCLRGLLSDVGFVPTNDWNSWLICFIQDEEALYHDNGFVGCYHTNPNAVQLLKNETRIKVYPNPVSGELIIQPISNNTEGYSLEIYSVKGELVKTECLEPGRNLYRIDASSLRNGIYILRLISDSGKIDEETIIKE